MLRFFSKLVKRTPVVEPVDNMAPFVAVVKKHVENRKQIPDYMAQDPIYQVPKYVVIMCEELRDLIGRQDVELMDVLRIEKTAVGHSDYQHKLALRCYHSSLTNETII